MGLVFDANTNSSFTSASSYSFSHTVGTTRLLRGLFVAIGMEHQAAGVPNNPSVTYNGVSMTSVNTVVGTDTAGRRIRVKLLYLANPATGSNTVAATWGGQGSNDGYIVARSYYGVDQTNPIVTSSFVSQSLTQGSLSLSVTSLLGVIAFDMWVSGGNADSFTVGANQTEILNAGAGTTNRFFSSWEAAVNSSTTMSWSRSGSTDWVLGAAYAIKPASAGGGKVSVSPAMIF